MVSVSYAYRPAIFHHVKKIYHLKELGSQAHETRSSSRTTLRLHVHLKSHLASLLDGRFFARARSNIALRLLLVKELACLSHSHANEFIWAISPLSVTTSTSSEHL